MSGPKQTNFFARSLTGAQGPTGTPGLQGPTGIDGPTGSGFIWKGEWVFGTPYVINDVVSYQGQSWIATGNLPFYNPGYPGETWELMVEKGAQGSTGDPGFTGPTGPQGPTGADSTVQGPTGLFGPALFTLVTINGTPLYNSSNSITLNGYTGGVRSTETFSTTNNAVYFQAIVNGAPSFPSSPGTEYVTLGLSNYFGIISGGNTIDLWSSPSGKISTVSFNNDDLFSIYATSQGATYFVNGIQVGTATSVGASSTESLTIATLIGYTSLPDTTVSNISIYITGEQGLTGPQGPTGPDGPTGPSTTDQDLFTYSNVIFSTLSVTGTTGTTGSISFQDGTIQTTAYQSVSTISAPETVITLGNLQAKIDANVYYLNLRNISGSLIQVNGLVQDFTSTPPAFNILPNDLLLPVNTWVQIPLTNSLNTNGLSTYVFLSEINGLGSWRITAITASESVVNNKFSLTIEKIA